MALTSRPIHKSNDPYVAHVGVSYLIMSYWCHVDIYVRTIYFAEIDIGDDQPHQYISQR